MKKEIYVEEEVDIDYEKIEAVIDILSKYKWMDATLNIDHSDYNISVDFLRLETDEEYDKRINKQKKEKELKEKEKLRREEKDRKEYERLKEKFG